MEEGLLQVWCYLHKGAIISGMYDDLVPLSDMPACTIQLYQTCMLGSLIHLRMLVKCCSIKQGIGSDSNIYAGEMPVTNPSDMPTGRMLHYRVVKLARYHPGCHLEYIKY